MKNIVKLRMEVLQNFVLTYLLLVTTCMITKCNSNPFPKAFI